MSGGYVKIARGIFRHNMFKDEPFTEREVWIWLICGASYKDDTIRIPNTNIVTQRAAKLEFDYLFQGVTNKLDVIEKLLEEHKQTAIEVCYIGDDFHDVEVLQFAGYAVVPKDATYECRVIADYVCRSKGGEGCVREVANKLLANQNNHE